VSETTSPWVIDISEADFDRQVIERSRERPVVVDFWAPWCGPCRMLGPILEQLAREKQGEFILAKVNIDENQRLALEYGIESIPAVKAFRNGRLVGEFVGLYPEAAVREFVDRLLPTEADRLAAEAAALEVGNPAEAEARYRRALELDRNNDGALVGLARLLVARGQDDEAGELLARAGRVGEHGAEAERLEAIVSLRRLAREFGNEAAARRRVEADPQNAEYRYQLGVVLAAAGRHAEALQTLLAAAEMDRTLAASQVREAMVQVFQVVGVRSELADEYRDKLTRLLY
jgi:putative thioredoxin